MMLYARRRVLTPLLVLAAFACEQPDSTRPRIVSTYPTNGASGVPTNTQIRVAFSEAMATASVEAAFSITPATAGEFEWFSDSLFYWKPETLLAVQTLYSFAVDTTAADPAGNRLEPAGPFQFNTGDTAALPAMVYMLGRSVMAGWFDHWGTDPYAHGRFTFEYHAVQSPPEIVASAQAIIDSLLLCDQPVFFFKLCFVDFVGGDSLSAQENLDRNVNYVDSVYAAASNRGLKMIAGSALPQVASATDQWLVWNHRQYNQKLVALAAQHPGTLEVFNMYSVLADSAGNLDPAYATNSGDSHPNEAGYAALDSALFPFLEAHY
ncbi:Ig-like domain-containing protein [candidate division WOR-3 bacterium]|nr:Ig-like domain-containing protein [candidate division WOR-3 bacterium]